MKRSIWKRILVLVLTMAMVLPTIGSILPAVNAYPNGVDGSTEGSAGTKGWLPDGVYLIRTTKQYENQNLYWTVDMSTATNATTGKDADVVLQKLDSTDYTNQMFVVQRVLSSDVQGSGSYSYYRIRAVDCSVYLNRSGTGLLHHWRAESEFTTGNDDSCKFRIGVTGSGDFRVRFADTGGYICTGGDGEVTPGETLKTHYTYTNDGVFAFEPVHILNEGNYMFHTANDDGAVMYNRKGSLVTYTNSGLSQQAFTVEQLDGGFYGIKSTATGLYLGAEAGSAHGNSETDAHDRVVPNGQNTENNYYKWLAIPNADGRTYSFVNYGNGGYLYSCGNVNNAEKYNYVCTRVNDLDSRKVDWRLSTVQTAEVGDKINTDSGVFRDTFNSNDTVRLPIKIYDYLNDGLLFESANANYSGDPFYGFHGGSAVPFFKYGANYTLGDKVNEGSGGNTGAVLPSNFTGVNTKLYSYSGGPNADGIYDDGKRPEITSKAFRTGPSTLNFSTYTGTERTFVKVLDLSNVRYYDRPSIEDLRYFTMIFRAHGGNNLYSGVKFQVTTANSAGTTTTYTTDELTLTNSKNTNGAYTRNILDLRSGTVKTNWSTMEKVVSISMTLPIDIKDGQSYCALMVSHLAFLNSRTVAEDFADAAETFMKNPGTFVKWQHGNNTAFSLLRSSRGGKWNLKTGLNTASNGYKTGNIGADYPYDGNVNYAYSYDATSGAMKYRYDVYENLGLQGELSYEQSPLGIYLVDEYYNSHNPIDMSDVALGESGVQFNLYTELFSGLCTMGLVERRLNVNTSTNVRRPNYSYATIAYVANNLQGALGVQEYDACSDASGTPLYNYNYVQGAVDSARYGEGKDLAQALRDVLQATGNATYEYCTCGQNHIKRINYPLGSKDQLESQNKRNLLGDWKTAKKHITTCYDAAYYLLNNIFVPSSYNTPYDAFNYLELTAVTLSDGTNRKAYVFDAGFTNSASVNDAKTSVVYDTTKKLIRNSSANAKTHYIYEAKNSTTLYPFLPIRSMNNTTGETKSPYFLDDGVANMDASQGHYEERDYNYVLQSSGEFVYNAADNLFFEFEGDDDVYLYINNQLVLDIGAAHSITGVRFDLNKYVTEAWKNVNSGTDDKRDKELALVDGESYSFDFYYMERHGTGANMRIVTNIRVTDGTIDTEKKAYQNDTEVNFGGIVNGDNPIEYGFAITASNATMHNLMFSDETIGVDIDYVNGLMFYGEPTSTTFEVDAQTNIVISNLNGVAELDGVKYPVTAAGKTLTVKKGTHTLLLHQGYGSELNQQATAHVQIGANGGTVEATDFDGVYTLTVGKTNTVPVKSVRITDKNGGTLDVTDLVATVTGHDGNGKETNRTTVVFNTNEELKQFLASCIVSAENQTGFPLTSGSGFWAYNTMEIRGFAYTLTEAQKDAAFDNEVQSTADIGGVPRYGSAKMRVFVPKGPQYYQWSKHDLEVSFAKLKEDLMKADAQNFSNMGDISKVVVATANGVENPANTSVSVSGTNVIIEYQTPGAYLFHLNITYGNNQKATIPVQAYVLDVVDSVFVLDYGLRVDLLQDDELYKGDYITVPGKTLKSKCEGMATSNPTYSPNTINFTSVPANSSGQSVIKGTKGEFRFVYNTQRLVYKPTAFMDQADTIYVAYRVSEGDATSATIGEIDINHEVEMYKKVTILPANVVYYEDDFQAINYKTSGTTNVINVIVGQETDGSDSVGSSNTHNRLTPEQSADQSLNYGYDPVYKDVTEGQPTQSAKTVQKITIKKYGEIANFTFNGTGFEIISRTTANMSGTMAVSVKDSSNKEVRYIPVITEFDHNGDDGTEAIYQVPVVRVEGLDYGSYTVSIEVFPAYDWSRNDDGSWNSVLKDSYLYIDGVRIYNPLGESDAIKNYLDTEQGAKFVNVRKLIAEGYLAQVTLTYSVPQTEGESGTTSTPVLGLGTSTYTFVEDRNSGDQIEQNVADSINDYLLAGPNTEVYLDPVSKLDNKTQDTALVLYVRPDQVSTVLSLQMGIRALDHCRYYHGLSQQTGCDGCNNLAVYVGVGNSVGTLSWETVASSIAGGTEQYFNIDFTKCPKATFEENGESVEYYQVVVKVTGGMAAVTNIKYKGLEMKQNKFSNDVATIKYSDGKLVLLNSNNEVVAADVDSYQTFSLVRRQMLAPLKVETEDPNPDDELDNPDDVTDPDDTQDPDDVTDPDDTQDPDDDEKTEDETKPGDGIPETGDISIIHWTVLAVIAMAAVLVLTTEHKRKLM